ncbi:glycosyltransferase involved in cell wall biosynthesis [Flavobacterium sp. PL11]|uniref:glycosyltransferase n=1 Tax=Flavobacterium sp. PL11 TaxID=3071717 RepID=UPI002E052D2D|nr:glycosyltransferase involved in cell wall biosynthesis [Flavobacterium sp. PL11]
MRVIHFTASKVWRGHEQMIIDIYESFRDNSLAENQLIICPIDSEIFRFATCKNLNVHGFEYKSEYDIKFAKKLHQIATHFTADIMLLHNSKSHTLAVLSALFFGLNIPLILFRTLIKNVGTNFLRKYKYNYKAIKKIICISDPVLEILKFSVNNHSKLIVIGSVVDTANFMYKKRVGFLHQEFNIPENFKIVGNVSAFCKVKDHYTWIDTAAELYKRGLKAKYVLIGDGPLELQMKEYAKSKGLEDEIIFAGFRNDINRCLPEFDLFLFTSNNEATGGVILESYACNVPVVAARAGGIPTLLIDNETGLLAEAGNAQDFADKLELLINDNKMQEKFILAGSKFLMATSTREIIGKKIRAVLDDVLVKY